MRILLTLIIFISGNIAYGQKTDNYTIQNCREGICFDQSVGDLTDNDIKALKDILKKNVHDGKAYEIIYIKSVIRDKVFLLSASKPDYFGIEIVLSKEGSRWDILKKVEKIY